MTLLVQITTRETVRNFLNASALQRYAHIWSPKFHWTYTFNSIDLLLTIPRTLLISHWMKSNANFRWLPRWIQTRSLCSLNSTLRSHSRRDLSQKSLASSKSLSRSRRSSKGVFQLKIRTEEVFRIWIFSLPRSQSSLRFKWILNYLRKAAYCLKI